MGTQSFNSLRCRTLEQPLQVAAGDAEYKICLSLDSTDNLTDALCQGVCSDHQGTL